MENIILVENNNNNSMQHLLTGHKIADEIVHLKTMEEVLSYVFIEEEFTTCKIEDKTKLVVFDLKMPNSIEMLSKIKTDERTKKLPVIVIAQSDADPAIDECLKMGIYCHIIRPTDVVSFRNAFTDVEVYWELLNKNIN